MTKSQNTKNEQQKDLCITSEQLTEQCKKGELKQGWYYLKVNEELANHPVIAECVEDFNLGLQLSYFYDFDVAKIEQVLAPVPSYEQWEMVYKTEFELLEQVVKLKELLEECSPYIGHSAASRMIKNSAGHKKDMKLLTKINEVLK